VHHFILINSSGKGCFILSMIVRCSLRLATNNKVHNLIRKGYKVVSVKNVIEDLEISNSKDGMLANK